MEKYPQRPSQERALFPWEKKAAQEVLSHIEVLEGESTKHTGSYLTLHQLRIRNHYESGHTSDPYDCDVVNRPGTDAVAVIAYTIAEDRLIHVAVREGIRPPAWFRNTLELTVADSRAYHTVPEAFSGVLEEGETGDGGIKRRASAELLEEGGFEVAPEDIILLGGGYFPSPGTYTEKVYLTAAYVDPQRKQLPRPEGPMEEASRIVFYELGAALRMCQEGRIPDPKAEMGFRRLADYLGFIPELGLFSHELPVELRDRFDPLGL